MEEVSGARFRIADGYAEVHLGQTDARELALELQRTIRTSVPVLDELMDTRSLERVRRLARMCYELAAHSRVTSIDREDLEALMSVRVSSRRMQHVGFLFPVLIRLDGAGLRRSGDVSLAGDHYAKVVSAVMSD